MHPSPFTIGTRNDLSLAREKQRFTFRLGVGRRPSEASLSTLPFRRCDSRLMLSYAAAWAAMSFLRSSVVRSSSSKLC